MTKRLALVGAIASAVLGALAGVWFTLNPPPDYILDILHNALWGAMVGSLGFFAAALWAAIILEEVLGVDVI